MPPFWCRHDKSMAKDLNRRTTSRLDCSLFALSSIVCIGLFLFHLQIIQKHAVNLPIGDPWGLIAGDNHPASIDVPWLYEQVNDHRTTTTKLFVWIQYHLDGWNIRAQLVLNFLIYGLTVAILVLFVRRLTTQLPTFAVLAFAMFLLSPIIWPDHFTPYGIAIHFWLLFFIIGAYFLFTERQTWGALVIACVASILSIYSFASGFITSFVLLLAFCLFKYIRVRRTAGRERIRELRQLALVAASVGGALVTWIAGYQQPAYVKALAWPYTTSFWSFFLNVLSYSFGFERLSRGLGVICLAIVLIPMGGEIWKRKGHLSTAQWCLFSMTLGVLADLSTIAMGRATAFGTSWSKVGEYPEHGMPLIVLSALNWALFVRTKKLKLAFISALWVFCLAAFSNDWDFGVYARNGALWTESYRCVEAYYAGTGDGHCRDSFGDYPHPELLLEQARRLQLSFYLEMTEDIRRKSPARP